MFHELFSLADVCKLLHVKPHKILYLLSVGEVPEPRLRVGGRRLWTVPEIALISEKLSLDDAWKAELDRQRAGASNV